MADGTYPRRSAPFGRSGSHDGGKWTTDAILCGPTNDWRRPYSTQRPCHLPKSIQGHP